MKLAPSAPSDLQRRGEACVVLGAKLVDLVLAAEDDGDARPRQRGDVGWQLLAQAREPLGGEAVRRGERGDDVRPAQAIVLRHPDDVGDTQPRAVVEHDDGERLGRAPAQRAHVGHAQLRPSAMATSGHGGAKMRAGFAEALRRGDRPPRRQQLEDALRTHRLHLVVETERIGDAARLRVHAGGARGEDPRAAARERALISAGSCHGAVGHSALFAIAAAPVHTSLRRKGRAPHERPAGR